MKELSVHEVKKIAELSMLSLNESETLSMVTELNTILQVFQALDRYPVPPELGHDKRSGLVLEEVASFGESFSRFRSDQFIAEADESEGDSAEHSAQIFRQVFPQSSGHFLKVPQVLSKGEGAK